MSEQSTDQQLLATQRMEAINHLAAGVTHEFNNVLQIVRGYVAFARNSLPEDSATRDDLDNALLATDRAANLSKRLLQFARAEDDEGGVADAADVVEALTLLLQPIIGENIRISASIEPGLPLVAAGDASLRQALLNLCVNARDAMPDGGDLLLEARLAETPKGAPPAVGVYPRGEHVCLTVTDTGQGMDEATRRRLFEPFFTTKESGEGTGLGLPMVAGFATSAGGAVRVSSQPGKGARFALHLPLAPLAGADNPIDSGFMDPALSLATTGVSPVAVLGENG